MSEMEQEKIVSLNADKSLRRALDIKEAKDLLKREGFCVSEKILVSDSKFLECVDEMATQITELKFGKETYLELKNDLDNHVRMWFTDKAQDFYNDKFDEYETLINNTLNVWNKQREYGE